MSESGEPSQPVPSKATSTQFTKGQSGNPKGRPKRMGGITLAQACRQMTPDTIKTLKYWLNQTKFPAQSIRAAEIILDRGHGKPVQPIADGNDHPALSLDLSGFNDESLKRIEKALKTLMAREVLTTINDPDVIDVVPVDDE